MSTSTPRSTRTRTARVGRTLGVVAVTLALVGFVNPADGIGRSAGGGGTEAAAARVTPPLSTIVRIERDFEVGPHSLAINELVRCPRGTLLTGGGTSLLGEPARPRTAPVVYTNGPVGSFIPGETQTWASEVANKGSGTFRFRQFALCARGTTS
jgi:hypothetical protein